MARPPLFPSWRPWSAPGVPPVPPIAEWEGFVLAAGSLLVAPRPHRYRGEESRAASFPAPADCSVAANVEVVAEPGAVALW